MANSIGNLLRVFETSRMCAPSAHWPRRTGTHALQLTQARADSSPDDGQPAQRCFPTELHSRVSEMKKLLLLPLAALLCSVHAADAPATDNGSPSATSARPALQATRATRALTLALLKTQQERILAAGERGHILYSDDGAKSWTQAQVPTRNTLTTLAHSHGTLFAGGHDGVLLSSADQGQTWQLLRDKPEDEKPVLGIHFLDDKLGFAIGAYGLLLRTEDGGASWQEQEVAEFELPEFGFPHLYRITQLRDGALLVIGEAGFIARSSDRGASWTRVAIDYEGSLFTCLQTQTGSLLVGGMRGRLFRSEDAGNSWTEINTGSRAGINALVQGVDGSVMAVGMDGILLESANDGLSFSRNQRDNRKAISSALPLDNNNWLLAAEDGVQLWHKP